MIATACSRSHAAGQLTANAWGLHDMLGNVWEWANDWYGDYPAGLVTDPTGPAGGDGRVVRGCAWSSSARSCRAAYRYGNDPAYRVHGVGLRPARSFCVSESETCDGLDNDCDGEVDEDFPSVDDPCTVGVGACARDGELVCRALQDGVGCSASPGEAGEELCGNGVDDDCDGEIDEGFNLDDPCSVGVGQCARQGVTVCQDDGLGTTCGVEPGEPVDEICDGLDNDCDGVVDEECCGAVLCPRHPLDWPWLCNDHAHCEYVPDEDLFAAEIFVPAGSFLMGAPEEEQGSEVFERPVHLVAFERGFFIGKYEVTVARHEECEQIGACSTPSLTHDVPWGVNRSSDGEADHPQNGLHKSQASAICAWLEARLPSEAEWEYAGSGSVHRTFPWGDAPEASCAVAVLNPEDSRDGDGCGEGGTWPVGSKPDGVSFVGAHDMSGNLAEYVQDCWHDSYIGAPADGRAWTGECVGGNEPMRGGAFTNSIISPRFRSAARNASVPVNRRDVRGVRCARDMAFECQPGATEVCDRLDNDCDGEVDEDLNGTCCFGENVNDVPCNGCPQGTVVPDGWVCVPAREFVMGSPGPECPDGACIDPRCDSGECPEPEDDRLNNETQHRVRLTRSFLLRATEVTQAEWREQTGNNPSIHAGCDDCPVEHVNWYEAAAYCNATSHDMGLPGCYDDPDDEVDYGFADASTETTPIWRQGCVGCRLPTAAEWEYAARAGTVVARYGNVDDIAWYGGTSEGTSHPVGQKNANAWGLRDMLGNVWEWVFDRFGEDESGDVVDPSGPTSGAFRIYRGGGFYSAAPTLRAAYHEYGTPDFAFDTLGFRCACSACISEPESCDGVDNDCDGQIDEDCGCQDEDIYPADVSPTTNNVFEPLNENALGVAVEGGVLTLSDSSENVETAAGFKRELQVPAETPVFMEARFRVVEISGNRAVDLGFWRPGDPSAGLRISPNRAGLDLTGDPADWDEHGLTLGFSAAIDVSEFHVYRIQYEPHLGRLVYLIDNEIHWILPLEDLPGEPLDPLTIWFGPSCSTCTSVSEWDYVRWGCLFGGECTLGEDDDETCDGLDNDCDGAVDEGFGDLGGPCAVGVGACERTGEWVCDETGESATCGALPGSPSAEACGNARDDDCDGEVDEICRCEDTTFTTTKLADPEGMVDSHDMIWDGEAFSVVWMTNRDGPWNIYYARVSSAGQMWVEPRPIASSPDEDWTPKIAQADNGFALLWKRAAADLQWATVFFQLFGFDGEPIAEPQVVVQLGHQQDGSASSSRSGLSWAAGLLRSAATALVSPGSSRRGTSAT